MRWFLVRFRYIAVGFKTRDKAKAFRDRSSNRSQTIEVIPIRPIRELLDMWEAMAKKAEFENTLNKGEIAVIKAMRQDLLERLDAQ